MLQKKTHSIKITIIIFSLLLHGCFVLFLVIPELNYINSNAHIEFIDDLHTQTDYTAPTQENSAPQIAPQQEEAQQQSIQQDDEWGEMKMGKGTFGAPVSFTETAQAPEIADPDGQDDASESSQESTQETTSQAPQAVAVGKTFFTLEETKPSEQPKIKHSGKKKKGTAKGVTLAHLTQGYLDSLDEGGSYTISMAGNPNKLPTQDQLQFENFSSKLIWQVQNIHHINFERFNLPAMESSILIYFMLDRKGHMSNLKILRSSGNAKVDDYILYCFKEASGSFPALPPFIKEDPAPLKYNLQIYFAPESNVRVHRNFR